MTLPLFQIWRQMWMLMQLGTSCPFSKRQRQQPLGTHSCHAACQSPLNTANAPKGEHGLSLKPFNTGENFTVSYVSYVVNINLYTMDAEISSAWGNWHNYGNSFGHVCAKHVGSRSWGKSQDHVDQKSLALWSQQITSNIHVMVHKKFDLHSYKLDI